MFINKLLLLLKSKIKFFKDEKQLEKDYDSVNLKGFKVHKGPLEGYLYEKTVELNEAERNFVNKSLEAQSKFIEKGLEAQQKFIKKQQETNLIQKSSEAFLKAQQKLTKL